MANSDLEAYEMWVADPATLTKEEMASAYRFVAALNAMKKRSDPPTPGPRLEDVILAFHPTLICGEGAERSEWFVCKDHQIQVTNEAGVVVTKTVPLYEPVPSIANLLGRILHKVERPTDGWRNVVTDLCTSLAPKCAIKDLSRSVLRIDFATKTAHQFENDPSIVGVVACKTTLFLLRKDGTCDEAAYDRTTFVLNRLPADPDPAGWTSQTEDWVVDRLGEDQAKAFWDWCAYCLTPRNTYKRIHLWLGATDSGKSTGVRLLTKILGQHNVASYNAEQLVRPFILADLRGKLINVGEEDPGYGHKFEAILKTISGGTAIPWEIKYGASGASIPTFKCLFTSNNSPGWVDSSGAYGRRMVVLRWGYKADDEDGEASASIPLDKQRPMSEFDEMFEEELPGILWMLLHRRTDIVQHNDIHVPSASRKLVEEIARESNSVATWLGEAAETLLVTEGIAKHAVYSAYADWCKAAGNQAYSYQTFFRKLKQHPLFRSNVIREEKNHEGLGRIRKIYGLKLPVIHSLR